MAMRIVQEQDNGTLKVKLAGQFTFEDRSGFRQVIDIVGEKEVRKIVFYMDEISFVDSSALGMLLLVREEAEKFKKPIVLSGVTGQVKKIFDLSNFHELFDQD